MLTKRCFPILKLCAANI